MSKKSESRWDRELAKLAKRYNLSLKDLKELAVDISQYTVDIGWQTVTEESGKTNRKILEVLDAEDAWVVICNHASMENQKKEFLVVDRISVVMKDNDDVNIEHAKSSSFMKSDISADEARILSIVLDVLRNGSTEDGSLVKILKKGDQFIVNMEDENESR